MRFSHMLLLISVTLSSCVAIYPLQKANPVGTVYKEFIEIGNKTIPLLQGEWEVVSSGTRDVFYITYLVKKFGENEFSYLKIQTNGPPNIDPTYSGYTICDDLERKNLLHVVKNNNIAGERQDGWFINNIIPHISVKSKFPVYSEFATYLHDNKLLSGNNYILVRHRLTGKLMKDRFLEVSYYYNPSEHGFSHLPTTGWGESGWNAMRIFTDPKKEAFIEKLKTEHSLIHKNIKESFDK